MLWMTHVYTDGWETICGLVMLIRGIENDFIMYDVIPRFLEMFV